ncbi:hypothetical protein JX265_007086 [Neoarthrinium moseri]|uniref:Uncharacterized protein n=1 Tax=Neoarthrinium moseri TaxID=1658444 RepID=A0A9P9WKM6_9PEZI|nr:hypothetical protein JX265_007086 [Neoarthrinium moseri]
MTDVQGLFRVVLFGSGNGASSSAAGYDPARDIQSLAGKVVLITGAAGFLGRQTAAKEALAQQIVQEAYGDHGEAAKPRTEICFVDLDLSSLDAVRECAANFVTREKRLDILFLNAGIIRVSAATTKEGYEAHFGINYLGHALLARLLTPEGQLMAPTNGIDFDSLKSDGANMHYAKRYGQSKVALIGLTKELSRECPQVRVAAVHPGRILTGMAESLRNESLLTRLTFPIAPLFCVPVTVGIRNHLWAATSTDVVTGTYYEPLGVPGKLSSHAKDEDLFKRFHEWTDDTLSIIKPLQ